MLSQFYSILNLFLGILSFHETEAFCLLLGALGHFVVLALYFGAIVPMLCNLFVLVQFLAVALYFVHSFETTQQEMG